MIKVKRYKKTVKKVRKLSFNKRTLFLLVIPGITALVGMLFFYTYILKDLPSPTKLSNNTASYSSQIYDRKGALLYTLYSDKNQTFVPIARIPKDLQEATIAIEDKDFYRHGAVDFRGITRAAYSIFVNKQIQGGSTLTQQLVKTSLLSPEQTLQRKVKEVILAFATEIMYSKDEILEMYLNQVPYGGTQYGVGAASQTFFGKDVSKLTLAENAYLAALPESPSTLSPFGSRPERGKMRQQEVLRRMHDQGYITKAEYDKARKQELKFQKISNPIKAPHFVFYVRDLLIKKYGQEVVEQGGLKIQTSLDLETQAFAQKTVAEEVDNVKQFKVGNGAALVTNPATGEVLAMVGSTDYFDPKQGSVNLTTALRQPGSSIKPINYAVGLMNGYSAATPFVDQPVCFPQIGEKPYCPRNYDGRFRGVVQMRYALANSLNIPAVQMLKLNGLDAMIKTSRDMGITTFKDSSNYGLSLTLGGGEIMMTDMATAFGVFANQGYRIDLHPILKITDRKGKVIEEYKPPKSPIFGKKVMPSEVSFIISDILADNTARSDAFGSNSELKIDKQRVSVKTGTTNDYKDNWTIGYTPSYVVAVWVGNNDSTPMSGISSGVTGAAPIWNKIMTELLEDKKPEIPQKPPNVYGKYICTGTGQVASGNNAGCSTRYEYLIRGTEEKKVAVSRQKVFIDKGTQQIAKPGQTENVEEREESIITDPLGNKFCVSCARPTPEPTP